ncbi:MAG: MATE family efflux transporter [Gammaproteobacteria bacterium]|nr:MATE family efflux transporter [Gammaproteobacteria bacterium]
MKNRYLVELKQLIRLASPLLAAQLLVTATGVVDTLMAGRYHANDLAAVAIGNSFWLPLHLLISGLLIATTSMVARAHGAEQLQAIKTVVQQSIWLSLALALLCVLVLVNIGGLLEWLAVDSAFAGISEDYLLAIACGFPAIAIYSSLRAFCEGMGRTMPYMIGSLVAFLANIPLNYALIYGAWGLPELGGAGCGWATAASMWLQVAILVILTARSGDYQGIRLFSGWQWPAWQEIKPVARLGVPIALAVFAEVSIFSTIALLLAPLGAVVVAGHQIALTISHLIFMIPLSFSQALTIRVGYFLGRGQQSTANFVVRTGLLTAVALALLTATSILLLRHTLVGWFTTDAAVQAGAVALFVWMALYQIPDHIQIAANAGLRAYQDSRVPMLLILLAYWGVALPLGFVLARTDWWGVPLAAKGFWIGLLVGLAGSAVLLSARLLWVATRPLSGASSQAAVVR